MKKISAREAEYRADTKSSLRKAERAGQTLTNIEQGLTWATSLGMRVNPSMEDTV